MTHHNGFGSLPEGVEAEL